MNVSTATNLPDETHAVLPRTRRASPARPSLSIGLVSEHSAERQELESGIKAKFESIYGAQLSHFLPSLLRLRIATELGAVIGVRAAHDGPLFLEQYTDRRVEQFVAGAFETPVNRDHIVEIGNLAADDPGLAYTLFAVLAVVLNEAGYRWVACTATPQVEAMLAKMKFSSRTICSADPERLKSGTKPPLAGSNKLAMEPSADPASP